MRVFLILFVALSVPLFFSSAIADTAPGYWSLKEVPYPYKDVQAWDVGVSKVESGDGYIRASSKGEQRVGDNWIEYTDFEIVIAWKFTSPENYKAIMPGQTLDVVLDYHLRLDDYQMFDGKRTDADNSMGSISAAIYTEIKGNQEMVWSATADPDNLVTWDGGEGILTFPEAWPGDKILIYFVDQNSTVTYTYEYVIGTPPQNTGEQSPPKVVPLCPKALKYFSKDQLANAYSKDNLRMSLDDIWGQFEDALDDYNETTKATQFPTAFAEPNQAEQMMLLWLFTTDHAKIPDPGSWTDAAAWRASLYEKYNCTFTDMHYVDFQHPKAKAPEISEYNFAAVIVEESKHRESIGKSGRLQPGDIFGLALKMTKGNTADALLLSHNTLRSAIRGYGSGLTGVERNHGCAEGEIFEKKYLAELREGDNGGPWYHLFGTAYFEMAVRNDQFAQVDEVPLQFFGEIGTFFSEAISSLATEYKPGAPMDSDKYVSWQSRIANELEQLWRERQDKNKPDPEKYCVNIWGQVIAQRLADRLPQHADPNKAPKPARVKPFNGARTVTGTDFTGMHVDMKMCPVKISISTGGHRQAINLVTGELAGDGPVTFWPVAEPGGQMGVMWFVEHPENMQVTIEAVEDGVFHSGSMDFANRQVQGNVVQVKRGDVFAYDTSAAAYGTLTDQNGGVHRPVSMPMQGAVPGSDSPPVPGSGQAGADPFDIPGVEPISPTSGLPGANAGSDGVWLTRYQIGELFIDIPEDWSYLPESPDNWAIFQAYEDRAMLQIIPDELPVHELMDLFDLNTLSQWNIKLNGHIVDVYDVTMGPTIAGQVVHFSEPGAPTSFILLLAENDIWPAFEAAAWTSLSFIEPGK